jgi:hypothetical protein
MLVGLQLHDQFFIENTGAKTAATSMSEIVPGKLLATAYSYSLPDSFKGEIAENTFVITQAPV